MGKRKWVILLLAALLIGAVPLTEDPPLVAAPKAGGISGRIVSKEPVGAVAAVCRTTGKEYAPAAFDAAKGEFAFRNLPGDAVYDIRATIGARTIEGIDLSPPDARMRRLAEVRRKQLGLPPERTHEFSQADVEEILKFIRETPDFMEVRRVLYLKGDGPRVTVLVELMRTREFYAGTGQLIWRVELWYFQEKFGGWERTARQEQVLQRRRISPAEWRRVHLEYYPALSVAVDAEGKSVPVRFDVPAADISRGRLPGTEPKVETPPHVLGLSVPASGPASRPAGNDGK